jgi:hypothetical protein
MGQPEWKKSLEYSLPSRPSWWAEGGASEHTVLPFKCMAGLLILVPIQLLKSTAYLKLPNFPGSMAWILPYTSTLQTSSPFSSLFPLESQRDL